MIEGDIGFFIESVKGVFMLIWFSETKSTWKHLELDYYVS